MSEPGTDEGLRERVSARGEQALGEIAQLLLENPVFSQALQAAFGARDLAQNATNQAIKNLNLPTASDVDRVSRHMRSLSDRLEQVEDRLDDLGRELKALRAGSASRER